MKKALKFLDENLEAILLLILLAAISIIMFMQIIMRFVFHNALNWPEEFCRICFVYSGFICFSYCQRKRSAIKIDVIVNLFPNGVKKFIDNVGEVFLFVFYAFLFVQSIFLLQTTASNGSVTSALQLPLVYEYFALTLGTGLAGFRSIEQFVKFIIGRNKGGVTA
ncbi:MAG: TRAP transporter small permease [Lachnospiraceae bacterium]|nr:TRAP transporter small permease [Lachnospiraceae bacterium]